MIPIFTFLRKAIPLGCAGLLALFLAACSSTGSSSTSGNNTASNASTRTSHPQKGGGGGSYEQDPGLPQDAEMPWSNQYGAYPWDDYPF